jgi:hypothetical protein
MVHRDIHALRSFLTAGVLHGAQGRQSSGRRLRWGDRDDVEIIGALRVHDAVREAADQQMAIRHAAPASPSAGPSKLARSSAASSARAVSLRRSASANTADTAFVMARIVRLRAVAHKTAGPLRLPYPAHRRGEKPRERALLA